MMRKLPRSKEGTIVGIDLSGLERRPTGWALLKGVLIETKTLYTDSDIIAQTIGNKPILISVDAPLTLPKGGPMRKVDVEMHKRGYPVLPPLFPGMKTLTNRAVRLLRSLVERGMEVIETHPESTRKALGLPKDPVQILESLGAMGFMIQPEGLTQHEIDAVLAALTAHLHRIGKTEAIGDEEGHIIVPKSVNWRNIRV